MILIVALSSSIILILDNTCSSYVHNGAAKPTHTTSMMNDNQRPHVKQVRTRKQGNQEMKEKSETSEG